MIENEIIWISKNYEVTWRMWPENAGFLFDLQGLSEFIIEDVCVNVQTLAVTINLRYDSLLLDGEYDISGKLVKVIPLSTRGPFTVTASNAKVSTA